MMRSHTTLRSHRAIMAALALASLSSIAAAQAIDPNTIVGAGLQAAQMIDAGKVADIWDGASPIAQKQVPKPQFVQAVTTARQALGPAKDRSWWSITRSTSTGTPELPAGAYVNVEYVTTFVNGKTARELVSFRFDEDKQWRVTGYFLR